MHTVQLLHTPVYSLHICATGLFQQWFARLYFGHGQNVNRFTSAKRLKSKLTGRQCQKLIFKSQVIHL